MLLSIRKGKKITKEKAIKEKSKTNKQATAKQTKSATTYNIPCLHHRWRCYQTIALND